MRRRHNNPNVKREFGPPRRVYLPDSVEGHRLIEVTVERPIREAFRNQCDASALRRAFS